MTPRLWAFLCTPMKLMYFSQIIKIFKLHYDFFFINTLNQMAPCVGKGLLVFIKAMMSLMLH